MQKRPVLLTGIMILPLCILIMTIIYNYRVYQDMQRVNRMIGISENPPYFGCPLQYYHDYLDSKLSVGMSMKQVEGIIANADNMEEMNNQTTTRKVYEYKITSLPLLDQNHVFIYLEYDNYVLIRYAVDNS